MKWVEDPLAGNLAHVGISTAPQHDLRRVGAHPDFWYPLAW